jgi:hypothetical protein
VSVIDKRPDIRELVGSAVNTSALTFAEGHERPLDRIAALGAAALAVTVGADRADVAIASSRAVVYGEALDVRDVIAGELGPMLWHLRYGGQHELLTRAIPLYTQWLRKRRTFETFTTPEQLLLLERFSARALHEWLSDRCIACGGSGKLERTRSGSWIRPRGSMQRNAVFRVCSACNGTRQAMASHGERARWLEITNAEYDEQRWLQRFNAARAWLAMHAARLHRPLTAELERRKRRI